MPLAEHSEQHHRDRLQRIARRAMIDRGLLPDFSAAAVAELEKMGVAKIFTPGAPMHDIVDWVRANVAA